MKGNSRWYKIKKIFIMYVVAQVIVLCLSGVKVLGGSPTVPTFTTNINKSVTIETENTFINSSLYTEIADGVASGGLVVSAKGSYTTATPPPSVAGIEFDVTVTSTAKYYVWVRSHGPNLDGNSVYVSVDGSDYAYGGLQIDEPGIYTWSKVFSTTTLTAGSTHKIRIHPRRINVRIDKIIINTNDVIPSDGTVVLSPAPEATLPPNAYPIPTITPPAAHPRLMFKSEDIPTIKANMAKSKNTAAKNEFNKDLLQVFSMPTNKYYNAETLGKIESWAFEYAINGTTAQGQKAVNALLAYLPVIDFSQVTGNVTRSCGYTIFTASEVYDWCYPLLTDAQKYTIRFYCEVLARSMEIGWPPSGQGAISTHAGEAQLLRDLLSFSIATYNERSDIYNYSAGRYLSEFIQPRNFWYDSHTHDQGDSYGPYRFGWDMWSNLLFKKMSGITVLSSQAEFVPYQWIYMRRPDGQLFREGDCFHEEWAAIGTFWYSPAIGSFYSAAAFENPYVRWQFEKNYPVYDRFLYDNNSLSPVQILAFNNPDAPTKSPDDLPLTKYFGSPNGMMIARTGWDDATSNANNSSNVVAVMKIGELWTAGHNHLDAGHFQLYYKGILASDSGQYDDFNSDHARAYQRETIAHNSLLIYDPNEEGSYGMSSSGGQWRSGGEPKTFDIWLSDQNNYRTGKVLDHEFGPDPITPEYTYIKGDITKAYTSKVSEVVRSMLFMPTEDADYPAVFFVMDKVTATNPEFKKTWLIHMQEQPTISGNITTVQRTKQKTYGTTYYNGRMHLQTLLPHNSVITPIGGTGNQFHVNGINYEPRQFNSTSAEPGWGRVEISPPAANTTDYFLNVMCVSDNSKNLNTLPATLIGTDTDSFVGAKISNRVAIFSKDAGRTEDPFTFSIPGSESGLKIFVSGVKEGCWKIEKSGARDIYRVATKDGGTLYFDGSAGTYTLTMEMAPDPTNSSLLSLSYSYNGRTVPIELIPDEVDSNTQENRYRVTLPFITKTYSVDNLPTISAMTDSESANLTIKQITSFPGTAKITVTPMEGAVRNYYVRFKYPSPVIGEITNHISTANYKAFHDLQPLTLPELREVFTEMSSKWEEYNRCYVDRDVLSISSIPSLNAIPDTGNYIPDMTWAIMYFSNGTKSGDSTTYFNGSSWIATANDDKVKQTGDGQWVSFEISRGATVWVAGNTNLASTNLTTANGWTDFSTSSDKQIRHGDGTTFQKLYSKHFPAGQVMIPVYGVNTFRAPLVLIMWDMPGTGDTSLSSLTATVNGDQRAIDLMPSQTTYTLQYQSDSIPVIRAEATDESAEVLVVQSNELSSSAIVTVASGANTKIYTINMEQTTSFGDINSDGIIDISDVIMTAEIAVGYTGYTPEEIARSNVSGKQDVTVDISDVVMIIERAFGSTVPFPVELP